MTQTKSLYHGHHFPAAIISCAVRSGGLDYGLGLQEFEVTVDGERTELIVCDGE
ncbi:hypothetical protein [Cupriavidus sp. CuC1]|uniref:hypothetical protein n=1 Tax=Cupriavidus sp. CuC1 TaxID=3373131 RepID=UPI0037D187F8